MQIKTNYSLKAHNTFNVDVSARKFVHIQTTADLINLSEKIKDFPRPLLVIGSGSNILFTTDFKGTILHMDIKGLHVIEEKTDHIWIKAAAGENWSLFVRNMLAKQYYGLENLSLIPGTVGASPVQNIGAYGVEVADCIDYIELYHLKRNIMMILDNNECNFAYRDSIFKAKPEEYIITAVVFKLAKKPHVHLNYTALAELLKKRNITQPTPQIVADLITEIRMSKLPDPKVIPNVGSFFKNPVVTPYRFKKLKQQYPHLIHFPVTVGQYKRVKLSAGQLIELAGFKGKQIGEVSTYPLHALIVINCGAATGKNIYEYTQLLRTMIKKEFFVDLEPEPRIIT